MAGGKLLTTVTLRLYEGGETELEGMDLDKFGTSEYYFGAANALIRFCSGVVDFPETNIPGLYLFRTRWVTAVDGEGKKAHGLMVEGLKDRAELFKVALRQTR